MDKIDKNYLRLQFWNKVYQKNATEFQIFFESIMQKAFSDFEKVRPYGNRGDGGNDGYRPTEGAYYQVYAPQNPLEKEKEAACKLKEDFEKLKINWDKIANIKKFYFVFNDKGTGTTMELAKSIAELKVENSAIEFSVFTSNDLEKIFFGSKQEDMLALGFDVDSTKAISNAYEYLEKVEIDLDRENGKESIAAIEKIKPIILKLQDEELILAYEILEARALQKLEKMPKAKDKYESLCKRYPNDPRAFLYLAEFYLNKGDLEKNAELLGRAEKIDSSYWLLALEKLIREYRLGNQIDIAKINDKDFPSEPRLKSNFYRLHSLFLERSGDRINADSFIERAIYSNPEKFYNYNVKLSFLENRIFSQSINQTELQKGAEELLFNIEAVERKASEWGGLSGRSKMFINLKKFNIFRIQGNLAEMGKMAKESFEFIMQSFFDQEIDGILSDLLMFVEMPPKDFELLLKYIGEAEKTISDDLAKAIALQFIFKGNLFTEGKQFLKSLKNESISGFIDNLENKKYDEVLLFLKEDLRFAVALANMAKELPELRKKIIENLPNDGSIEKDKLLLLLNYDEKNIDEAFRLLKGFDLSKLNYFECRPILKIAEEKKAWDFVIIVLEKLLQYEKDEHIVLQLKLQLFSANLDLEKFPDAIRIGEEILSNGNEMKLLDDRNKELLLGQTISARMRRGEYSDAKLLLEKFPNISKTFEFKIAIEAEVYLKNKDASMSLASIVDGIRILKTPTPEQYGGLYIFFTEIGNLIDFPLVSLEKVKDDCFVKFKDQDRWYLIGGGSELDATKVFSTDEKYSKFLGKKVGEKIVFDNKYSSNNIEHTIENILSIEKYILWQCMHHAQELSRERRWDAMEIIEVPTTGGMIDTKYVIARLQDERKKRGEFFKIYCRDNVPLAFLAVNEGGLTNAMGLIINEKKGFIKFSTGDLSEINQQKEVAKRAIKGDKFYIDGTSALILSESGLLEIIYKFLPNLKVPQSVINLLLKTKEKFRYTPGQTGYMAYVQGKLTFLPIDSNRSELIQRNFEKSIKFLESKPENIGVISMANKTDCFSEQRILPELCDACILAQKDSTPVLTEDFFYLQANELETKKKAPEYYSAFALIGVLCEQKKITFDQYLNFFSYLSSYRFRFLPLDTKDIEKAVFGDGNIKTVQPERIRNFNFSLTLSEDYGVPFDTAFLVVGNFLIKVLIDDSILPETVEKIFSEIISVFPTDKDKRTLGRMFLRMSIQVINNTRRKLIIGIRAREKISLLSQFIEIYSQGKDFHVL